MNSPTLTEVRQENIAVAKENAVVAKWKREVERRRAVIHISREEFDSIPRYDATDPTGVFFHKIFARDVNEPKRYALRMLKGDWQSVPEDLVIVEYCLGYMGELGTSCTHAVYRVEFIETKERLTADMTGDYGYTYRQFINKVYEEYAK